MLQVGVLLGLLPTADEVALVQSRAQDLVRFGRVELFFLQISNIDQPQLRLGAIQVKS